MATMTYRLKNGTLVTSRDGKFPLIYVNRTGAAKAAAKIPGATVYKNVLSRPFYVAVPPDMGSPAHLAAVAAMFS